MEFEYALVHNRSDSTFRLISSDDHTLEGFIMDRNVENRDVDYLLGAHDADVEWLVAMLAPYPLPCSQTSSEHAWWASSSHDLHSGMGMTEVQLDTLPGELQLEFASVAMQ